MGLKTPAIENEADIPVNAVVSLRDAVIASYQRSEMKVPIARRSKLMHINVLLVGGGAHIKHLSEKLREQYVHLQCNTCVDRTTIQVLFY